MESLHKLCNDYPMWCGALCATVVLVLVYLILIKEGFIGFVSAPIAAQRPNLLGVGGPIRFSSEFSSTNQGRDNLVSSALNNNGRENLTGYMEFPSIPYVSGTVTDYQHQVASTPAPEGFGVRNMYTEYYKNNVDNRLKNILAGGN